MNDLYYLNRHVDSLVQDKLDQFIQAASPEVNSPKHWKLFYQFVAQAFTVRMEQRPSVSQLGIILREAGFKNPGSLAVLYSHILYTLAVHHNLEIYGSEGFNA